MNVRPPYKNRRSTPLKNDLLEQYLQALRHANSDPNHTPRVRDKLYQAIIKNKEHTKDRPIPQRTRAQEQVIVNELARRLLASNEQTIYNRRQKKPQSYNLLNEVRRGHNYSIRTNGEIFSNPELLPNSNKGKFNGNAAHQTRVMLSRQSWNKIPEASIIPPNARQWKFLQEVMRINGSNNTRLNSPNNRRSNGSPNTKRLSRVSVNSVISFPR